MTRDIYAQMHIWSNNRISILIQNVHLMSMRLILVRTNTSDYEEHEEKNKRSKNILLMREFEYPSK